MAQYPRRGRPQPSVLHTNPPPTRVSCQRPTCDGVKSKLGAGSASLGTVPNEAKTRHWGQSPMQRFLFQEFSIARPVRTREFAGRGWVVTANKCMYNGATTASRGLPPGRCAGMRICHLPHAAQSLACQSPITSDDPCPARLRADALRLRVWVSIPGRSWFP